MEKPGFEHGLPVTKVQGLPPVSPVFSMSLDPGQGDIRTLSTPEGVSQKGVPSFAGMAGLPGRLRDTQRQGLLGSSGALSTVLPRAAGAAI